MTESVVKDRLSTSSDAPNKKAAITCKFFNNLGYETENET